MFGRLVNFNLLTPANVIAIGAIIFFWGALAYFARNVVASDAPVSAE